MKALWRWLKARFRPRLVKVKVWDPTSQREIELVRRASDPPLRYERRPR